MNPKLTPDNPQQILVTVARKFGIKISNTSINWLISHPQYPSLHSFGQLFKRLKLKYAIIYVSKDELPEIPTPFIAHIQYIEANFFVVINEINEHTINITNAGSAISFSKDLLLNHLSEAVMIFDPTGNEKENNFTKNKAREIISILRVPFLLLSLIIVFAFVLLSKKNDDYSLLNWLFLGTHLIGTGISLILLLHLFEENNLFFQKACSINRKRQTSCNSILNSKGAQIFGIFPWSEIGFLYFLTLMIFQLLFPGENATYILGFISFLAAPFVIYSIGYQKYTIGAWCKLCLFVQILLSMQFVFSLFFINWSHASITETNIDALFLIIITLSGSYSSLKPLIVDRIKAKNELIAFKKIKFDPAFFSTLPKRPQINKLPENLSVIKFGNSEGFHEIIVVSDPLCYPCQKIHQILLAMLDFKENTVIKEIFLTGLDQNQVKYKIAILMLYLYKNLPADKFKEEIKLYYYYYYYRPEKWINRFSDFKIDDQELVHALRRQNEWCAEQKIISTPVILYKDTMISGSIYTINDFDYLVD